MPNWTRPSICSSSGDCVEVAFQDERVLVRDSRRPSVILRFTHAEWRAFLDGAANGEFDRRNTDEPS